MFAIVMGFALLLTGFGFLVLTLRVLRHQATAPDAPEVAPRTAVVPVP